VNYHVATGHAETWYSAGRRLQHTADSGNTKSTEKLSRVQDNASQIATVLHSTWQFSTACYSALQDATVWCSAERCNVAQGSVPLRILKHFAREGPANVASQEITEDLEPRLLIARPIRGGHYIGQDARQAMCVAPRHNTTPGDATLGCETAPFDDVSDQPFQHETSVHCSLSADGKCLFIASLKCLEHGWRESYLLMWLPCTRVVHGQSTSCALRTSHHSCSFNHAFAAVQAPEHPNPRTGEPYA